MDRFIIFFVGVGSSAVSEVFWRGKCRRSVALWGGIGMLLLRRIVLRFPLESRALLCICGGLLLMTLRLTIRILRTLSERKAGNRRAFLTLDVPSLSYGLYRFLLIAPAYTVIEYLETCFKTCFGT